MVGTSVGSSLRSPLMTVMAPKAPMGWLRVWCRGLAMTGRSLSTKTTAWVTRPGSNFFQQHLQQQTLQRIMGVHLPKCAVRAFGHQSAARVWRAGLMNGATSKTSSTLHVSRTAGKGLALCARPMPQPPANIAVAPPLSRQPLRLVYGGSAQRRHLTTSPIVRRVLFDIDPRLIMGAAIGGLVATIGGIIFMLHGLGFINAGPLFTQFADMDAEFVAGGKMRIRRRKLNATPSQSSPHETVDGERQAPQSNTIPDDDDAIEIELIKVLGLPTFFALSWLVGGMLTARSRLQLRFRDFAHNVNFSLTTYSKKANLLKLRTIKECTIEDILPENAVKLVIEAARKTTPTNKFVALPLSQTDLILNQILNAISPLFSSGYFADACGKAVAEETFFFGLTYNIDAVKMKKIRVVIAAESLLQDILEGNLHPQFEAKEHINRWHKLQEMANLYKERCGDEAIIITNNMDNTCAAHLGKFKAAII